MRIEWCICSCLKPKAKRYRLLRKGRQDLAVETDIVNLLKQLRAIWTILDMKLHTSKKDVEQIMKSQRRTIEQHVDPDEDSDE